MPKNTKTRKQKMKADSRRNSQSPSSITRSVSTNQSKKATPLAEEAQMPQAASYSLSPSHTIKINKTHTHSTSHPTSSSVIATHGYSYLTRDLTKTTIITGAIVIVELLFYYFT